MRKKLRILGAAAGISLVMNIASPEIKAQVIADPDLEKIVESVLANPPFFGIPDTDGDLVPDNTKIRHLYSNYYEPSPDAFVATGTRFGPDTMAIAEIEYYGEVLRQQMWRGYALLGSGMYGYHPDLESELHSFLTDRYPDKRIHPSTLLETQNSPLYLLFADSNLDEQGFPTELQYEDFNIRQKRIFDVSENPGAYLVGSQNHLTPAQAAASGKYIGFVSAKSPNDMGRAFLLFDRDSFKGVALAAGVAKRSDWTGITNHEVTQYNPLGTRVQNNQQWGFDLPDSIYYGIFDGKGGPVFDIVAVDLDYYRSLDTFPYR